MNASTSFGEYLRGRREQLRPEDVGLSAGDRRRVPGLRREEVALLAGISTEYYLRLEQGRDRHPSAQVLDSIGHALQLDDEARAYLLSLSQPTIVRRPRRAAETVSSGARSLIDSWTTTPAYIDGASFTVLAANPLAVALSPHFAPGENTLRALFFDPEMRTFYRDWESITANAVPYLRSMIGSDVDDPRAVSLIGELSLRSDRFRALWARQDVRYRPSGMTRIQHPLVGPLDLSYEKLLLPGKSQVLVAYHAEPASESAERLQLLASLTS